MCVNFIDKYGGQNWNYFGRCEILSDETNSCNILNESLSNFKYNVFV